MWKNKILDFFLVVLTLIIGFFFFQLVRGNAVLKERVQNQELKASILIDEIGQAKEENQKLFQEFIEANKKVDQLQRAVKELEKEEFVSVTNIDTQPVIVQSEFVKVSRKPQIPLPNTKNFLIVGHHKRLADTMMIAAVDDEKQKMTLISIPRDLFVNGRKLNEYLNTYGISKLKEKIEQVSGLQIENYFVLNFQAFETIIDSLSGIDIYVEKPVYDPFYPDGNGGYTLYAVEAGSHHMSGAQALKYARSRHSTSDFDRAFRQQQIFKAVQERILNFDILNNLGAIKNIFDELKSAIETDIEFGAAIDYLSKFKDYRISDGNVLTTGDLLYSSTNIAGQYILLPRSGSFAKIQKYVRELLN